MSSAPIPQNIAEFTLGDIARATGGRLIGDAALATRGVGIDTRTIAKEALFVALRTATNDGHKYLAEAQARGASAAIVETGKPRAGLPAVEVADTLVALGALGRHHLARERAARSLPTIAIGGAVGKTTTKELTAAVAHALFGPTVATTANFNNRIGVPLTIFTLTHEHRAIVLECGTNQRGEIAHLAGIVEPDVAMVLNVDLEHTEGLGTLDDVADEEAALFSTARRIAIVSDAEPLVLSRIPAGLRSIRFGTSAAADVRLVERVVTSPGHARVRFEIAPALIKPGVEPRLETDFQLLGEAAALNGAAAIAAGLAMSATPPDVDKLRAIASALASVAPIGGRLDTRRIGEIVVLDDTYNSSPRALVAALAAAHEVAAGLGGRRLLLALGDMLELGALSAVAHADALRAALEARPAAVIAVGEAMIAAVRDLGGIAAQITTAPDSLAAAAIVCDVVRPGDVLLVKGSRGIAMERIIAALERR
jgi:UDP-N-acetylmuramoyl-tripeptide--D-alanyl-D-alanine ligase